MDDGRHARRRSSAFRSFAVASFGSVAIIGLGGTLVFACPLGSLVGDRLWDPSRSVVGWVRGIQLVGAVVLRRLRQGVLRHVRAPFR
jgi:hypothetical protein